MSELNIAVLSDIHFGNKKNTTAEIVSNLNKELLDNKISRELDIIFLAGDIFDTALFLPDNDVSVIDLWIARLLQFCAKYSIILRILEGTPSHDWSQSERFITIAKILKEPVDVKYIKDLSIEYIDKLDINVLYVPDEWEHTTEKTLKQVHGLLKAKGIDEVDYAIMHGCFDYQLPEYPHIQKHDSEEYLKIVKELIFIGHIHTFSKHDRIIAQGSFDRLSHGEEEPKGYVRISVNDNGDRKITFVENKGAKLFKSINCTNLSLEDTLNKISTTANSYPPNTHVRVIGDSNNPIFSNMNMLIRMHPLLVWSKLVKDNKVAEVVNIENMEEVTFTPITITNSNIKNLLLERIINTETTNPDVLAVADGILNEVI